MIIVDLRPNYRAGYSHRHWTYFRSFRMNAKRRHNRRLTRSSLDSLSATLAALPSMSLAPLAPFRDFWGNDKGRLRSASRGVKTRRRSRADTPLMVGKILEPEIRS